MLLGQFIAQQCFNHAVGFTDEIARLNRVLICRSWAVPKATVRFDYEKGKLMSWGKEEERMTYTVVVNHEEQYSIWPSFKDIPDGWQTVGKTGNKEACLTYIKEVWTNMRPLSLCGQMNNDAGKSEAADRESDYL